MIMHLLDLRVNIEACDLLNRTAMDIAFAFKQNEAYKVFYW